MEDSRIKDPCYCPMCTGNPLAYPCPRQPVLGIGLVKEIKIKLKNKVENNKYYTPTIEEFHMGFEFEHLNFEGKLVSFIEQKKEWNKEVCDWDWLNTICDDYEHNQEEVLKYRVKYLDKEDIESLGFKCIETLCPFMGTKLECKLNVEIGFNTGKNVTIEFWEKRPFQIHVKTEIYSSYGNPIDTGRYVIKNKTELKKLLKQKEICK